MDLFYQKPNLRGLNKESCINPPFTMLNNKQQATSNKQQATSNKQQATSN
jgi:hypothetical protein